MLRRHCPEVKATTLSHPNLAIHFEITLLEPAKLEVVHGSCLSRKCSYKRRLPEARHQHSKDLRLPGQPSELLDSLTHTYSMLGIGRTLATVVDGAALAVGNAVAGGVASCAVSLSVT